MQRAFRLVAGPGAVAIALMCVRAAPALAQEAKPPTSEPASATTPAKPGKRAGAAGDIKRRVQELEAKLQEVTDQLEQESLEQLVQEAQNEARAAHEEKPEERTFLDGGLSLQKLNPEITFSADMLPTLIFNNDRLYASESDRSGLPVRAVGLHIQHVLDPYSLFKSAFHIDPADGLHLEEVYVSWSGLIPSTSLTIGRFRQNFGVLNRWHDHDLDQTEHPLALKLLLGDEGLVGNGVVVQWLMPPLWADANELIVEVVNGSNETLFAGEHFSVPSTMAHLKSYYDLSDATYFELGLTGMFGFHNKSGVPSESGGLVDEPWRKTLVGGADVTFYWSPPERARYRSLTWRTELYLAHKERGADEATLPKSSWGLYSYLQYQLSARWFVGTRGDVALPTLRDGDELAWDVVPYVTFWQSEFVYMRLEYRHGRNIPVLPPEDLTRQDVDNRVMFQVDFAAGPHKHEKY